MTIRQKIHLSNILMVILPIAATAFFIAICLETSLGDYWYAMETMYKDEHGIQSAQSLIYTFQQELWENNWGQGKEAPPSGEIQRNEKMNHLEEKLSDMGYHFMIVKNGNEIFSNISREDMAVAEDVAGQALWSAAMLTVSERNNVWWFLGFFVMMAILVNGVLSWWISKSVLLPLRRLKLGTRQIREGNLNEAIDYGKNDELGKVCRDLSRLVESLSEYNRLDSRSFPYELRPDDLIQFLEEYRKGCQEEARQNKIEYSLECDRIKTCPVLLDRNELKRVFDNLFMNTVRYREKENSRVRISVRTIKNQNMAECVFADNGPGVPEESLGRLFDSFYRVDGARSNAGEGSGIGLAIVKEIINGHKGNVWAENHDGLSIVIQLPFGKHTSLKPVITDVDTVCGKIRAAVDARRDPNFLIIGRSDTPWATGDIDDAVYRANRYLEAGADAVLLCWRLSGKEGGEQKKRINGPLIILNANGSIEDEKQSGASLVLYWPMMLYAAFEGCREAARLLMETRDIKKLGKLNFNEEEFDKCIPFTGYTERVMKYMVPSSGDKE